MLAAAGLVAGPFALTAAVWRIRCGALGAFAARGLDRPSDQFFDILEFTVLPIVTERQRDTLGSRARRAAGSQTHQRHELRQVGIWRRAGLAKADHR